MFQMSPLPLPCPPLTSPSLHPVSTFSIMTAPLPPLVPSPFPPSNLSSSPPTINRLLLHLEGSQTWTNPGPLFTFDLVFCQFRNCFLAVREFGHKLCSHSCKNARNLTHGGWCASAFKYGGSVTCWYLFGQCLLQCGQSRVSVAGVGLKALDSFPQTSQLFVLILQLLQQILDLKRERRDRELSEASTVREGKCSRPGLILHTAC